MKCHDCYLLMDLCSKHTFELLRELNPQPDPIPNSNISVWETVIEDMKNRNEIGIEKYGTPLQPFNGRNSLQDAYEEVLDLAVYLKQKLLEDKSK